MGKNVYANGMAVAAKVGGGKVIAAFPDVCMSPPPPPAGPVPIPYPNSSFSKDLKQGSKTVKVGGKPIALKDSFYKTSPLGNEAATKNFGASVLSHQTSGKTQFVAYSFDVKVEGKNVCRHIDLTTSNHGSYPGSTPPMMNMEKLSLVHQEALDAIEEERCPCCKSKDCPAAFKDGEEPLSMKEAMGLDPSRSNYNAQRAEDFKVMKNAKRSSCTCKGNAFPKPPCDVFREPEPKDDQPRYKAIIEKWNPSRYRKNYTRRTGLTLKVDVDFLETMVAMSPFGKSALVASGKLSKSARAALKGRDKEIADAYKKMQTESKQLERINHLTPKEYGGCPNNDDNLQPQQTLCSVCQEIDQWMTDDNW